MISTQNYLIKQLPKATVFINTKFEVIHVSDKWINYFDYSNIDLIGKNIFELFDSVSKEWHQVIEDCLLGKSSDSGIEMHFDSEGKKKWFEWVNIPWYDEYENIIGVIVQTEDITKKVLTELRFNKMEALLTEKLEIAKIGNWEYDAITDTLIWSKMTKMIHEVPMDYVPDVETAINFYKEGYDRNVLSMAMFNASNHGTSWKNKLQLITAKGKTVWVIAAGKPIFTDGKYTGLIGTFQDITEQVQTEIKTIERKNLLRALIDNLPLNVYIKDLESKKILVNKAEIEFSGFEKEEDLIGKDDFDFLDESSAKMCREEDVSVMKSLKPLLDKEDVIIRKDGKSSTFLTSKIPLIEEGGNVTGLIGFSLDISNLKQKEEELRNLINVTSLQNKKLIDFAHIISHNLRSHTANFSMLLEFLVNEKKEKEKKKIISMLVKASDNLLETLGNLNDVITINTNTTLKKKSIRMNDKIDIVNTKLKTLLKNNKAKIKNKVSNNDYITAVPSYLESILMNFITNAVKYKHADRDPIITLSLTKNNDYSILSIADNGIGIDLKKYGDKLFGMYKTFHNNADAKGIGLYITKNQIEAMSGKIITSSEVGKGTIFNIYFNERI
ncbi:MAG: hypothetical protein COA50_15370 [Flavobacteriaceae bacterium]|nr:MAG: hypothetical protein COA50_15370 [Flavobacteriaceae bacterium]